MKYTHSVSEEERRMSEQLGNYLGLENASKIVPTFAQAAPQTTYSDRN
jgi:hypothetical protein